MILSKRVALNGVQLDELDERIVIRKIVTGTPKETVQAVSRMGYAGQRMTGQHFDLLEIKVDFALDIQKRDMDVRREVFDLVKAWALRKGWLTISYLTGRRAYIDNVAVPDLADPWDWTADYTLTFRAYNVPFWQDDTPGAAVFTTGTSGSRTMDISGNVKSVLDAEFRNMSGKTINNFSINAGGNVISLSSLGLGGSATLTIDHDAAGLLRIRAGNTNVYQKYTGADDLYVNPGTVAVSFNSDRAGLLTVRNYGRWI